MTHKAMIKLEEYHNQQHYFQILNEVAEQHLLCHWRVNTFQAALSFYIYQYSCASAPGQQEAHVTSVTAISCRTAPSFMQPHTFGLASL